MSSTFDALVRMEAGIDGRTLAEKMADTNRPSWEQYKKETNSPLATRARFKDSVDFIGWYIHKTNKILNTGAKAPNFSGRIVEEKQLDDNIKFKIKPD